MRKWFFQELLQELFDYINKCKYHEQLVLDKYFKRYLHGYAGHIVLYIVAVVIFYSGTIILKKRFPIEAIVYSFSTESTPVYVVLYVHQFFAVFQTSTLMGIDFCVMTLLWYTGARFEILSLRLKMVVNNEQLKKCISEHQDIIR